MMLAIRLLKSSPFQLFLCFAFSALFAQHLPVEMVRFFYTLSGVFIESLMFFLPPIIFVYILSALLTLDKRSPLVIAALLLLVTISNCFALLTAYSVGISILPRFDLSGFGQFCDTCETPISFLWDVKFSRWIGTDTAMLLGAGMGIISIFLLTETIQIKAQKLFIKARDFITMGLQRFFIPLLPLYVFGFSLKISYEGTLFILLRSYTHVFVLIVGLILVYVTFLYLIASGFSLGKFFTYVKNMIPAGLTGFSTMSSAATLPFTLKGTEKNIDHKSFVQLVIPSTSNIHMLGDDLMIVLTALALLLMKGCALPSLDVFIVFSLAFCVAKFSCVGIPGASVLVILPVLQQFLGFSPEMISILTTIYILQDPIGTFGNVMGNGAFAIISHRVFDGLKIFPKSHRNDLNVTNI